MNRISLAAFAASAVLSQTALTKEANPQLSLVRTSPTQFTFDWTGEAGWTYFVQTSTDGMMTWDYVPEVEHGTTHDAYPFITEAGGGLASKFFVRLQLSNYPVANAAQALLADFDGDGLSNRAELKHSLQTSPLDWDSDMDGLNDGWEVNHGYNPKTIEAGSKAPSSDSDSDGYTNLIESLIGLNPSKGIEVASGNSSSLKVYLPGS